MGKKTLLMSCFLGILLCGRAQAPADPANYLTDLKEDLQRKWPKNRTINLVFHGHSVPAGYWHNSEVHTLESYPYLVLAKVKEQYPHAVVNAITTAIGGENSLQGEKRMADEVLNYRPDVLFIDYALNDMWRPAAEVVGAWESMIRQALDRGCKVILITPSPDQREDILAPDNRLVQHAAQIRTLAAKYQIGLADPFVLFQQIRRESGSIEPYMSHVNHPNRQGHELMAGEISRWFGVDDK